MIFTWTILYESSKQYNLSCQCQLGCNDKLNCSQRFSMVDQVALLPSNYRHNKHVVVHQKLTISPCIDKCHKIIFTRRCIANLCLWLIGSLANIRSLHAAQTETTELETGLSRTLQSKTSSRAKIELLLKSVGGASLFLFAVEIAWQLHNRLAGSWNLAHSKILQQFLELDNLAILELEQQCNNWGGIQSWMPCTMRIPLKLGIHVSLPRLEPHFKCSLYIL